MADHRVSKRFRSSTSKTELTGKNLRKIRVFCSDPEATESFSDESDVLGGGGTTKTVVVVSTRVGSWSGG
ncbi:hypothetical protein HanIR_Chr12g0606181 [Helianthus annuus]|nr:hypothetical protein HanIR_Chr12g0606181 [Helianthus annuus]